VSDGDGADADDEANKTTGAFAEEVEDDAYI
jgi:hypothetical protein